jgi:hypothetical protein
MAPIVPLNRIEQPARLPSAKDYRIETPIFMAWSCRRSGFSRDP